MTHTIGKGLLGFLKCSSSALILGTSLAALPSVVQAQQADQTADDGAPVDQIVITGSRIRRDEFSSAAPLQTYDTDAARQIGVNSISEMLQRSTIANGQQINGTLNTNAGNSNASEPPPLGGVGSANIGLRGLEPARTLVLINGRRLGSSGVRGAPAQPDINLLPLNLVERIEVITEGASSVYGADAVAGVVNILLRDSFEGMEVSGNVEVPFDGGGETYQFSMLTGAQTERAKFVFAAEFFERQRISVNQRRDCNESLAIDATTGERLETFCNLGFFDNMVFEQNTAQPIDPRTGLALPSNWFFATPGSTDVGVAGWSSALVLPEPTGQGRDCRRPDERCRGLGPIDFFSGQDDRLRGDLVQPITRFSTVALGSYELDFFGGGEEVYFEAYYFNRHSNVVGAIEQIFPTILGQIPELDANGAVVGMVDNPLNPFDFDAVPILTLDDINQDRQVELQQFRFVGGFRGDFPSGFLAENNWSYDLFASYDRGAGFVTQDLLSESNLILATQTLALDADGNVTCGVPIVSDVFGFVTQQECVPVDFFAPSVLQGGPDGTGTFATDAERNFLIGQRVNRTLVEQFMTGVFFTGDLFQLPAGDVGMAFGAEYRKDSINSAADFLSANALNAGENPLAEGATNGSRNIFDVYGEVNVPLISNAEFADYVGVEGAVRYTDESNFGSKVTTRARFTFRPNDWVQMSGSYGTSFRAPNLRETFLAAQFQGISSSADPCGVPPDANNGGTFDPSQDNRSPTLIANCIQSGADPTQLGLIANINIPVIVGGNAVDLTPETSRSFTATIQVSPPVSKAFDVDFAVSFFDIRLKSAIRSLSGSVILTRCFEGPANLASPFCDRITRTQTGPETFKFVNAIDAAFVNVGSERSQGIDVNARFRTDIDNFMGDTWVLAWSGAMTFQTKRNEQIFAIDPINNLNGDFGLPKRRLNSTLSFSNDSWDFLYATRHLSGGQTDFDTRLANDCDVVDDALNRVGPNQTLPVCSAPGAWYHDVSATYRRDNFYITAGINNLLDKTPPLVSRSAGSNRANRVTSSGYDQVGRTVFLNIGTSF